MKNSSWKARSHSTNKEISCILRNLKVHTHVQNNPPQDSTLGQFNPAHILQPYFFEDAALLLQYISHKNSWHTICLCQTIFWKFINIVMK